MVGWPDGKSRVAREPPLALHQGHISRPKADFVEDSWENTCDFPRLGSDVGSGRMNEVAVPRPKLMISRPTLLFLCLKRLFLPRRSIHVWDRMYTVGVG